MARVVTVDSDTFSADTSIGETIITQIPSVSVEADGTSLSVSKVKVNTNRFSEAGTADITALPPDSRRPKRGEELTVSINENKVFTGEIRESTSTGEGTIELRAYDVVKKLLQEKVTASYSVQTPPSLIASEVGEIVGAEVDTELNFFSATYTSFEEVPCAKVLSVLAKRNDMVWWVDENNVINIKPPESTRHIIGPNFISPDTDVGEKSPPYKKVVVKGESPAGVKGVSSAHQFIKGNIVSIAGEGKPVYRYNSKQIKTQEQADNAAQAILKEFKRQRASGTLTLVGEGAPIRLFDAVEVPNALDNITYLVSGVKHTFNSDSGYITDIDCGGFIDG